MCHFLLSLCQKSNLNVHSSDSSAVAERYLSFYLKGSMFLPCFVSCLCSKQWGLLLLCLAFLDFTM